MDARVKPAHDDAMVSLDALFDASRKAPRRFGRGLIKAYRYTFSPLVGFDCRHLPTCSEYADQAVERYGLWGGSWMTLARASNMTRQRLGMRWLQPCGAAARAKPEAKQPQRR